MIKTKLKKIVATGLSLALLATSVQSGSLGIRAKAADDGGIEGGEDYSAREEALSCDGYCLEEGFSFYGAASLVFAGEGSNCYAYFPSEGRIEVDVETNSAGFDYNFEFTDDNGNLWSRGNSFTNDYSSSGMTRATLTVNWDRSAGLSSDPDYAAFIIDNIEEDESGSENADAVVHITAFRVYEVDGEYESQYSGDSCDPFTIWNASSHDIYPDPGETNTLNVAYEGRRSLEELTATWSFISNKQNVTELGEGTVSTDDGIVFSYTTEPAAKSGWYRLIVSDGEYSKRVDFEQQVGDYLYLDSNPYEVNLYDANTTAINATASKDGDLYCIWRDRRNYDNDTNDYEIIAEGNYLLSIPVSALGEYDGSYYVYLKAWDQYENEASTGFYITKKNLDNFYAENYSFEAQPGEDVTFTTVASAVDVTKLTYKWEKYDENKRSYQLIEGATQSSYTVEDVDHNSTYRATVTDDLGYSQNIIFSIYIPQKFSVSSAVEDENGYKTNDVYTTYGNTADLAVTVTTADESVDYTVDWKKGYSGNEVAVHDTESITTDPITGYTNYYACVTDQYGNEEYVQFYVDLTNGFSYYEMDDEQVYSLGDSVTLNSALYMNDSSKLTCKWWVVDENGNKDYFDETGSTLTINNVQSNMEVFFSADDGYGNVVTDSATVSVYHYFWLYPENYEVSVTKGNSATLKVYVADNEYPVSYAWYDEEGTLLSETSATFTTPAVNKKTTYKVVVSDEFGNSQELEFTVYPENHLSLSFVNDTLGSYGNYCVFKGEDATVKVNVTADETDGMLIKWEVRDSNGELLEGNFTGLTEYTFENITMDSQYTGNISVTDKYGNTVTDYFNVSLDKYNHFDCDFEGDTNAVLNPGEHYVAKLNATARDMSTVTYEWSYTDENGEKVIIFTEPEVDFIPSHYGEYYCKASDSASNLGSSSYGYYLNISIENHLKVTATQTDVKGAEGATATLSAQISADVTDGITCSWRKGSESLSETGNSLTVTIGDKTDYYTLTVKDKFGNYKSVDFTVAVDNGFGVTVDESYFYVVPGGEVTLTATVTANNWSGMTYEWFEYYTPEGETSQKTRLVKEVKNATVNPEFTVTAGSESKRYYLKVTDKYGSYRRINYYVNIENHLKVVGGTDSWNPIVIEPGKTATLTATVTADDMDGIVYEWFGEKKNSYGYYVSESLGTTEDPSLVISADDGYRSYQLTATDKYGNTADAYYSVRVENHLTVTNNTDETLYGTAGNKVTVSATVTADDMDGITYTWYKRIKHDEDGYEYYERKKIGTTVTPEMELTFGSSKTEYVLEVEDKYGNESDVYWSLGFDNQLSVTRTSEYSFAVAPGESVTFTGLVSMNDWSDSDVAWYQLIEDDYSSSSTYKDRLEEATLVNGVATLSFTPSSTGTYLLEAVDCYGNVEGAYYDVTIATGLSAEADCGEPIDYNKGRVFVDTTGKDSVEFKVKATSNYPETIKGVSWQALVGTSSSYSTKPLSDVDGWSMVVSQESLSDVYGFRAVVADIYGNTDSVYFYPGAYYIEDSTFYYTRKMGESLTLELGFHGTVPTGSVFRWERGTLTESGNYSYAFDATTTEPEFTISSIDEENFAYRVNLDGGKYYYYFIEAQMVEGPECVTVRPGDTATFTVSMEGAKSYQWKVSTDGGDTFKNTGMTGNKTATLSVPATLGRSGYKFYCEVTGANGKVYKSNVATLTVQPIVINAEPWSTTVYEGDTAVFNVRADGDSLSCQWQVSTNGGKKWSNTSMAGNKTATLSFTAALSRNNNQYRCKLTDKDGNTLISAPATLTVKRKLIASQPQDAYVTLGSSAKFTVTTTEENLSLQWQVSQDNGINWKNTGLTGNKTDTLTVKLTEARKGWLFRCVATDADGNVDTSYEAVIDELPELMLLMNPFDQEANVGDTAVFEVGAIGNNISYQWEVSIDGGNKWKNTGMSGNKTATLSVPVTQGRNGYKFRCVLTSAGGKTLTTWPATLNVAIPLSFVRQPENVYAKAGDTVEFSVDTMGPVTAYQWEVSTDGGKTWKNTGMSGNKTAILTVPVTASRIGYMFKCVVSNDTESITSEAATILKKEETLAITKQPVDQTAGLNEYVTFSVETNVPDATFQWKVSTDGGKTFKNTSMSGNKTANLKVQALENRFGNYYRCVITGSGVTLTSDAAKLNPSAVSPLTIDTQPKDASVKSGTNAKFTVAVSCSTDDTVTYQWNVSKDSGKTWKATTLSGNKTKTLTVGATEARNGWMFKCVVTAGDAVIESDAVTLSLLRIEITGQPANKTVAAGTNAKFTVTATSLIDSTLSYQWQVSQDGGTNWKNSGLTGNKTKTLTVGGTTARNGWLVRCIITDAEDNSVTSNSAKLTVN